MERPILVRVPARTAIEIPPGAGPGGRRGWHDVVYRALDVGLGRTSPRARAWLTWRLDPEIYRGVREILDAFVHPGDTVLDVGASWGLFTYTLARRVAPGGRVIAFEPNPVVLPSLEAIAAGSPGVEIHRVALSDASRSADLHVPTLKRSLASPRAIHPMASLSVPGNREGDAHATVTVQTKRLNDTLGPDAERPISFVKCDVEGHELAVLRGAEAVLERRPVVLIEVEQRHQDNPIEDVFDLFARHGYEGYVMEGASLRPLAEFDVVRDQVAFLRPYAVFTAAPAGYLHNFLFVAADTDVTSLRLDT
jgi:FkbM family methyltransferase